MRARLIGLANPKRLPAFGHTARMADAGALFRYGVPAPDPLQRSAQLGDRVLKGAKPADRAVERTARFDLVMKLKAAKALGLTFPRSLLLRADEVIE